MRKFKYLCSVILCLSIIESVSAMEEVPEKKHTLISKGTFAAYCAYSADKAPDRTAHLADRADWAVQTIRTIRAVHVDRAEWYVRNIRTMRANRADLAADLADDLANLDDLADLAKLANFTDLADLADLAIRATDLAVHADLADRSELGALADLAIDRALSWRSNKKLSDKDNNEDSSINSSTLQKAMLGIMSAPIGWVLKEDGLNAVVSCSPMIINIAIATIFYSMYRACKKAYNYYYSEKHRSKQEKDVRATEKEFETKPNPIVFPDTAEIISYETDENPINLINTNYRLNSINSFNKDLSDIVLEKVYGEIDLLLQNNSMLTTLCLKNNLINDDIVRKICIALTNNTFLEELVLDSHEISDVGFIWISLALLENKNLKKLYLTNTQVTNYGLSHLAGALRKNKTLTSLYIDGNNIRNEGINEVRDAAENLDILFIHPKESLKDQLKREVDESFKLFRHKLNTFIEKGGNIIKKVFRDPTVIYSSLSSIFNRSFLRTENSRLDPDDEIIDDGI